MEVMRSFVIRSGICCERCSIPVILGVLALHVYGNMSPKVCTLAGLLSSDDYAVVREEV